MIENNEFERFYFSLKSQNALVREVIEHSRLREFFNLGLTSSVKDGNMSYNIGDLLVPRATVLQAEASSAEEILRLLASKLNDLGYVKDTYADAVVKREKAMPTGLPLGGPVNVAIPHTDPEHVLRPAIAMATLKRELGFANMEDPTETVSVSIVFLLAINDRRAQIDTLRQVMEVIQNPEILNGISFSKTIEEVTPLLGNINGRQE